MPFRKQKSWGFLSLRSLIRTATRMKSIMSFPGNDDAIRAVKLIAGKMVDAIIEGREGDAGVSESAEESDVIEEVTEDIAITEEV